MTLAKVISGSIFTFDELAGAVDAGAEAEVFKHFRDLKAGRLAVLISHRFSAVRTVDQIVVSWAT
jgi:ATP-binding cassette subfamily B protein